MSLEGLELSKVSVNRRLIDATGNLFIPVVGFNFDFCVPVIGVVSG
jgi:hypothetical protein